MHPVERRKHVLAVDAVVSPLIDQHEEEQDVEKATHAPASVRSAAGDVTFTRTANENADGLAAEV
jgi:hypothetical protein